MESLSRISRFFSKKFWSLSILIILLISSGLGGYHMGFRSSEKQKPSTEEKAGVKVFEPEVGSLWSQQRHPFYKIVFSYPSKWGRPQPLESPIENPSGGGGAYYSFEERPNEPIHLIALTKSYAYPKQTSKDGGEVERGADRIKKIFNTRTVDRNDPISLSNTNSVLQYFSNVEYLETPDSSLRGIYYYAGMGQGEISPLFNRLVIILTDGEEDIIQMTVVSDGINDKILVECNHNAEVFKKMQCKANKDLIWSFENEYSMIIERLWSWKESSYEQAPPYAEIDPYIGK